MWTRIALIGALLLLCLTMLVTGQNGNDLFRQLVTAENGNDLFQQGLAKERASGDIQGAIQIYERIVKEFSSNRPLVAKALVQLGACYEKLGQAKAQDYYQQVISKYADQGDTVKEARTRLTALAGASQAAPEGDEVRFLTSEFDMGYPGNIAVSPDGRWIVFFARAPNENAPTLWLRPIGSVTAQQLRETRGIAAGGAPLHAFWSPDSRSIGYFGGTGGTSAGFNKLKTLRKVDIASGHPQDICDTEGPGGATWNSDGVIVFGSPNGGLSRVPATGGQPSKLTALDPSAHETAHVMPYFLPDGRHYLYLALSAEVPGSVVYLGSLDSKERTRLFAAESTRVIYAAPGYLVFNRDDTLFAQPFDAKKLLLTGEPIRIAEQIANTTRVDNIGGGAAFSLSQTGVLIYRTASTTADRMKGSLTVVLNWTATLKRQ